MIADTRQSALHRRSDEKVVALLYRDVYSRQQLSTSSVVRPRARLEANTLAYSEWANIWCATQNKTANTYVIEITI